jgi:phosphomannomutase
MKFGTSGLRGLVSDMTDAVCGSYVAAFLGHLRQAGDRPREVLVGQDLRPSSARIAAACHGAIRDAGALALDCGVVPTPALALEAARRGAPAIMVTGSHIPFDRNGLKFYGPAGEISKADEVGIVAKLVARPPPGPADARPCQGVGDRYVARVADFFGPGCLDGLRIGVYQHSAAGRDLLVDAMRRLGAEAVALGRTDRFVPVDTEAIAPADTARIRRWVRARRLDGLVSTDGDGDRPLVADETGAVLRGDLVGMLTARFLGADAVATPVSSSTALERSGWFPRVVRTRIGSPHVVAAIEELNRGGATLPVGFEANGGFLLGGTAMAPHGGRLAGLPTRDALLPIAALLAMAAGRGVPLSALAALPPPRVTASGRLQDVPVRRSGQLLAALAADPVARSRLLSGLSGGDARQVDTLDGVRMTLASGDIVHLRMSGNAPELRCYCESDSARRSRRLSSGTLRRVSEMLRMDQTSMISTM